MRIGIISTVNGCFWAGSEETWHMFAMHAVKEGHQLSIQVGDTVLASYQVDRLRFEGARILGRKDLGRVTRRLAGRGVLSRFRDCRKWNVDVLFLSMGGLVDAIWMPDLLNFLKDTSVPIVVFVQANAEGIVGNEMERTALRRFFRRASKVIFLSDHNQDLAERQMGWHFPDAVKIMNPLRSEVNTPLPWPSTSGGYRFAQVARFELADKQQDHLLKAVSAPIWKDRDWSLTFFGSGPDEPHIKRLIELYGLKPKVTIGGYVDAFQDIWASQHLHILPSRREGMPLSLIESMACGRPAVVTRAGGSPELVEHGTHGWVCPGMHPEVLAETLETAWQSRDRWQVMGEAARQKILSVSEPNWADRILKIVKQAAGQATQQ